MREELEKQIDRVYKRTHPFSFQSHVWRKKERAKLDLLMKFGESIHSTNQTKGRISFFLLILLPSKRIFNEIFQQTSKLSAHL